MAGAKVIKENQADGIFVMNRMQLSIETKGDPVAMKGTQNQACAPMSKAT